MKPFLPLALLPLAFVAGCGSTPDPMPQRPAPAFDGSRLHLVADATGRLTAMRCG